MTKKVHVKKGDKVLVLAGKDRGKMGVILKVYPDKNRVVVEGINIVRFEEKYEVSIYDAFPKINKAIKDKLLILDDDMLYINEDKIYIMNEILNMIM